MIPRLVMIRGAGDLATGVAHRLWQSGFDLIMLELAQPLVVRRAVSFASSVFEKSISVDGVRAELCPSVDAIHKYLDRKTVPVLVDPEALSLKALQLKVVIDATMTKENLITRLNDAELVIGLGPGFTAGIDVHAVVETNRGHALGRVIYKGSAVDDTGEPGQIAGYGRERILRAPGEGIFEPQKEIGELVKTGDKIATVGGLAVKAELEGVIRGLLYPGLQVNKGVKIGDIDPRGKDVDFLSISDKARAVGGGVLEAILNRYHKK